MNARVNFLAEDSGNKQNSSTGRVLVPKQAVVRIDNGAFVFVIKGNKVEQRAIRPGGEVGDDYQVLEGLSGNESVALNGADKLRDGDRVKVQ
jgi:membrane fusion protein (multidrug efflux system)